MSEWKQTIHLGGVFHNEELSFVERRDAIVAIIKASRWFKSKDEFEDLPQCVLELSETETPEEFDGVWNGLYDEADADRVWIQTRDNRRAAVRW